MAIYAEIYPHLKNNVLQGSALKYSTIHQLLGVNHWFVIFFLLVMVSTVLFLVERFEKKDGRFR